MADRRTLIIWSLYGAGVLAALGLAVAFRLVAPLSAQLDPATKMTVSVLILAVTLPFIAAGWRRTDEAARQAQFIAWFYGGIAGVLAGVLTLAAFASVEMRDAAASGLWRLGMSRPPHGPAVDALGGAMALLLFQTVGFGIFWAGWWLKRR